MTSHTCNQCLVIKPDDAFYSDSRNTKKGVIARCKECIKSNQRKRNKSHIYSEKDYLRGKAWAEANMEKVVLQARVKRARNPDAYRKAVLDWESRYPERKAARRRGKRIATPSWAETSKMNVVYKKAKEMGLEVDHIVPITHQLVSGLHCWHNLQLLDKSSNSAKSNRWWPDMPDRSLPDATLQSITT